MLHPQNKVQTGVWLEPEVVANCDTYAEYFSQSRSGFINEALKLYLKHVEKHCELLAENEKNESNFHVHSEKSAGSITLTALFTIFNTP